MYGPAATFSGQKNAINVIALDGLYKGVVAAPTAIVLEANFLNATSPDHFSCILILHCFFLRFLMIPCLH
jgi:hypothetical protein